MKYLETWKTQNGCWLWSGYEEDGYGRIRIEGSLQYVHRAAYVAFVRPLAEGETVDHKCRNTLCCNPKHLQSKTLSENVALGNADRTITGKQTYECPRCAGAMIPRNGTRALYLNCLNCGNELSHRDSLRIMAEQQDEIPI